MSRRWVVLVVIILLAVASWLANHYLPSPLASKAFRSLLVLAVTFALFRVAAEDLAARRIRDSRMRYSLRKALSVAFWVVSVAVIARIWIPDPQALLVAYGLVGAGVAIALQDLFKNIAGGFILFLGGGYRVGDRIAAGSHQGDVIDIGIMYTTLLEIGEWVGGDQATGRIALLPNGHVLSSTVHNYTKDHEFLWDEIVLPITYDSNWKRAERVIRDMVREMTAKDAEAARQEVQKLEEKYYLSPRNMEPAVFIAPNDNWIGFHIRYVAKARDRRLVRDKLLHAILEVIQQSGDIRIASQTLVVSRSAAETKPPGAEPGKVTGA